MVKYADYDQVWLVKSAGLVLGPFSFIELTQALKERRVALLDEIRTPTSRWGFVRENAQLSELVKIIREAEARQSSLTGKTTVDENEAEPELTQSVSGNIKVADTTPTLINQPAEFTRSNSVTLVLDQSSSVPTSIPAPKGGAYISGAPFAEKSSLEKQSTFHSNKNKDFTPRLMMGLVAGLVIMVGVWWLSEPKPTKNNTNEHANTEMLILAKKTKASGFYDKALMMFERAVGETQSELSIKLEMLPLLIRDSNKTSKAQKMVAEILAKKNLTEEMSGQLANWQGLLLMKQGQFTAAEVELSSAIEKASNKNTIQINRVINFYFANQWDKAIQLGHELKAQGVKHPLISIAQGLSILAQPTKKIKGVEEKEAREVLADLSNWVKSRRDLVFESLLISAALIERIEGRNQAMPYIDRLIEQSAGVTHEFIRELNFDNDVISWKHLKQPCENLSALYSNNVRGIALGIDCQIEEGNLIQANSDVQKALLKFPDDQYLIGLKAAILKIQGHSHEAKEILSKVSTRPGLLIRAQTCFEEKDLSCADEAIKALVEKDQEDPETIFQQVQLNLIKDKRDLAEQMAEKGLGIARTYRPLLEIREEMGDL